MAQILDRNDVNYLTPQLEYDQLFEFNKGIIEVASNFFTPAGAYPLQYRTTGNGLIHLQALLFCNADFGPTTDILTPNAYPAIIRPPDTFLVTGIVETISDATIAIFELSLSTRQLFMTKPNTIFANSRLIINYFYPITRDIM